MGRSLPPGPPGKPFIGSLRDLQGRRRRPFLQMCRDTYGDVVHLRILARHAFLLHRPELIQQVLVKDAAAFHKTPMLKRTTRDVIGDGLLTSEDELHKRQRRLTQPAFHARRITAYAGVMVASTEAMLAGWQDGSKHEINTEMMKLTMQIVARTLFNVDISSEADEIGHAITFLIEAASERLSRPLHLPIWVPTPQNRQRRQQGHLLEEKIMQIINERRASGQDTGDLLSMLLLAEDENGERMTDRQVRDEAMTLFIAGHETTANALAWALYLLAQHPAVVAKLQAEVDSVLGGRPAAFEDLRSLRYTEMVIKEAMRLYPPAWMIARQAVRPLTLGEWQLRAGDVVLISPYTLHRHPVFWERPDDFIPERFEHEEQMPKYTYLPFGAGPRVCIGNNFAMMEAVLVLATIARSHEFTLLPGQDIYPDPLITLRPHPGIHMQVHARSPQRVIMETETQQEQTPTP